MAYPILDCGSGPEKAFAGLCALIVMAKAPRVGRVKTRLSPTLAAEDACRLNVCFLRDTTQNLSRAAELTGKAAGLISYTPVGEESLFDDLLPIGFHLMAQRGDGFGERLLCTAQDIFAKGFGSVCLIDSDSPTVPTQAFVHAIEELHRPGDRVVLGPSQDGGYYLIGMKRAHPEPFEGISWSTSRVAEETRARCSGAGIELIELPVWYDVDDAASLRILVEELRHGYRPSFATLDGYRALITAEFLSSLDLISQPALSANSVAP